eukprot:CAMPEP_0201665222 /NCGR_PEP_ID=MMETSP0494-20130426/6435_1 /ASSEMBLY_ACC=CAM_ASM_000839 /TAXON_ID=420259 /ORGANISM="Thalassiosira gravida, Strain GMp14c1" /LENGTH=647 /DNA_ID=CAMNT_0048144133 /DNA_START=12 /DNA_END=1955 /DNA_ORIENTATION=-
MAMMTGNNNQQQNHHHHHHEQQQQQHDPPPTPLCELRIADSIFLGYVCTKPTLASIQQYRTNLIEYHHPNAAHVPYAVSLTDTSSSSSSSGDEECECDDDDEPPKGEVGLTLLRELKSYKKRRLSRQATVRIRGGGSGSGTNNNNSYESDDEDDAEKCVGNDERNSNNNDECGSAATAIIVVRYFEERLLGVTCGRLRALYERTARLALHRHSNDGRDANAPFVERFNFDNGKCCENLYGLGAGDTELILDVVPESAAGNTIVQKLLSELRFETMVGSHNEPLPRLQNLQSDLPVVGTGTTGITTGTTTATNDASPPRRDSTANSILLPIYRYPGNYSGTEWPTHPWSRTALSIKRRVEATLRPLYVQRMNHCVSNLYRHGNDKIDRHSDKDLDLNRKGVIASVSLGSARVMELRDRREPHDFARVVMPPNSMFVLGPFTNARFTHAVLPMTEEAEGRGGNGANNDDDMFGPAENNDVTCNVEAGGRISLTFRDVRTFLDVKTQRLFGQGVVASSIESPIVSSEYDGVITNASLVGAVRSTREKDARDKASASRVAVAVGAAVGYVTSKSSTTRGSNRDAYGGGGDDATAKSDGTMAYMLRGVSTAAISAYASYWYLRRSRSRIRQRREEREARAFFSKKSASGNKY